MDHQSGLIMHSIQYHSGVFPEFNSYHTRVKRIFDTLDMIDTFTACDPPLEYRLYRLKNMAKNPTIVSIESDIGTDEQNLSETSKSLIKGKPAVNRITKGQLELLDAKRQPIIFVCPIQIKVDTLMEGERNEYQRRFELDKETLRNVETKRSLLTPDVGEQGPKNHDVLDDLGYGSLPRSLQIADGSIPDNVKNVIKRVTNLVLGCVADDHATSVLYLITSDEKECDKEGMISNVKVFLRDEFPNVYGNRDEDPVVHCLDNDIGHIFDTLFLENLKPNLRTLQSSVDIIQNDFAVHNLGEHLVLSEDRSKLISNTVSEMLVGDEGRLHEIAKNLQQQKDRDSRTFGISYSDFLRQKIIDSTFENVHDYIDREFSFIEKTTVSRALNRSSRYLFTRGIPDWTLVFVITALVLTVEVVSFYRFGIVEAFSYGFITICVFIKLETSYINVNRIVRSVKRDLQKYKQEIKKNLLQEHKRTLDAVNRRNETIFKLRIQIREMLTELGIKKSTADVTLKEQLKQKLLSDPNVVGFGIVQDKLLVHVIDEAYVADTEKYIEEHKMDHFILPSKPSDETKLFPFAIHRHGRCVNSNNGLFIQNCQNNTTFVLPSSINMEQNTEIYILCPNNKRISARWSNTLSMDNCFGTNVYSVTIFQVDKNETRKIDQSDIHRCKDGRMIEKEVCNKTVEIPNQKEKHYSCIVFAEKYFYKHLELKRNVYEEISLMSPMLLEDQKLIYPPNKVFLQTNQEPMKTISHARRRVVGMCSGILRGLPFPVDQKADLGKEEVLVLMPFSLLLDLLHNRFCQSSQE